MKKELIICLVTGERLTWHIVLENVENTRHQNHYRLEDMQRGKRDAITELFVNYEGITCPCCNRQLKCLPRRKGKEKYLEQIVR